MPTYDYVCPKCKKEHPNLIVSYDAKMFCNCGTELKRQLSAPNLGGMDDVGRSKT